MKLRAISIKTSRGSLLPLLHPMEEMEWWLRRALGRIHPWLLAVLSVASCSNLLFAADKSAVGPSAISVPKGPGSIEGLGESFQPSLNTGTAKYGVGMQLPP